MLRPHGYQSGLRFHGDRSEPVHYGEGITGASVFSGCVCLMHGKATTFSERLDSRQGETGNKNTLQPHLVLWEATKMASCVPPSLLIWREANAIPTHLGSETDL